LCGVCVFVLKMRSKKGGQRGRAKKYHVRESCISQNFTYLHLLTLTRMENMYNRSFLLFAREEDGAIISLVKCKHD